MDHLKSQENLDMVEYGCDNTFQQLRK